MNRHFRQGLLVLSLVTLAGCGESADTLLRKGINWKTELTDRLMKVTDEASAKKFMESFKTYMEKNRELDEKWQKWNKDIFDDYSRLKRAEALKDPRMVQTLEALSSY